MAADLFTLDELARANGQRLFPRVAGDSAYRDAHAVADVRHGWSKSEQRTGSAVRLTQDDYAKALRLALGGKVHPGASKRERR